MTDFAISPMERAAFLSALERTELPRRAFGLREIGELRHLGWLAVAGNLRRGAAKDARFDLACLGILEHQRGRHLAASHGGDLVLLTTGGKGTVFRLILPDGKAA